MGREKKKGKTGLKVYFLYDLGEKKGGGGGGETARRLFPHPEGDHDREGKKGGKREEKRLTSNLSQQEE